MIADSQICLVCAERASVIGNPSGRTVDRPISRRVRVLMVVCAVAGEMNENSLKPYDEGVKPVHRHMRKVSI